MQARMVVFLTEHFKISGFARGPLWQHVADPRADPGGSADANLKTSGLEPVEHQW